MKKWKFYYPEDGETVEDAHEYPRVSNFAGDVARYAVEYDYSDRDGWERLKYDSTAYFIITVVDEHGNETKYRAGHEPSVEHVIYGRIVE